MSNIRWLLCGCLLAAAASSARPGTRHPIDGQILFLPQAARDARFAHMERFYTGRVVHAGGHARALQRGRPLPLAKSGVDRFMANSHVAGLIVLQHGRVRLERYASGRGPADRCTSFSVAKSVTSTLVGSAIRYGYIRSLNDPVTLYLPQLKGSAYDGVTIAQLLEMRSGVRWNENYADPASDVVRLYAFTPRAGEDRTIDYLRRLPRAALPGTGWSYNTGETDLAGALVRAATHRPLATYLSEAIGRPAGMEYDDWWLTDAEGHEAGGSGLSMTLRDAARFGQLALEGGRGVVPSHWFAAAARRASVIDSAADGYGYLWWTYPGGRFAARGIFGQSILVDPASGTVIAIAADWPSATDPALSAARARFETLAIAAAAP
jgi:CubicO group peptidase (beta-lactamase class C family)